MRVAERFAPVYPSPKAFTSLFQISPATIFWLGFLPPLAGSVIAIVTALTAHQERVTNYNWICGRAFLPSLSRIINLDFEGIFWQTCMYFHFPLRLFEIYVGFVHVILFYTFGVFAFLFFMTNTICHSQSLYYLNPYGRLSYWSKIILASLYLGSVPLIATFYTLYWKGCITVAYELFALTEYIDVFVSMAFHGCALLDIRHKVIVEVRWVRKDKEKDILQLETFNKLE